MNGGDAREHPRKAPDGAASERTRLAWRRTVLTATLVALLAARMAIDADPRSFGAGVIAGLTASWLALVTIANRRTRALPPSARAISTYEVARLLRLTAFVTVVLAALGAVLSVRAG